MTPDASLVSLGRIAGAFGLRGDVKVQASDPTEFTAGLRLSSLLDRELDPSTARDLLGVRQLVVKASDRVRDVVFAFAPTGPSNAGLAGSVRSLLSDAHRTAGLETDLLVSGIESDACMPQPSRRTIFDYRCSELRLAQLRLRFGRRRRAGGREPRSGHAPSRA